LNCSICQKVLGTDRVRDHCHFTGRFRGAAHSKCNLDYKVNKFIPKFFHNFSKYDCHLFIQELGKIPGEISVIPINKENYISVSRKIKSLSGNSFEIRFLDTYIGYSIALQSFEKCKSVSSSNNNFHTK